jgi:formylglycine-generating enzyme required for sulfatase activity
MNTPETYTNSIGMEFILCPAGTFMMGSMRMWPYKNNVGNTRNQPVHQVTLTQPFYMGKYPVKQAQWFAVMGSYQSHFVGPLADRPVEMVSWEDAQKFIKKLNQKEKTKRYRLPTEAEWEYAARAGTTTEFFWGEDEKKLSEYAWFNESACENFVGSTHPVGQKKANPWGLHDVYGNVSEWVQDWWSDYTAAACIDPRGPASGDSRVMRGGSWGSIDRNCRSAVRNYDTPGYRHNSVGFRLALSPE